MHTAVKVSLDGQSAATRTRELAVLLAARRDGYMSYGQGGGSNGLSKTTRRRDRCLVSQDLILSVFAVARKAQLDRVSLLAGLDPAFTAAMPVASSLADQHLQDLHYLNGSKRLSDGTVPLRTWLLNAAALLAPRSEARQVRRVLSALDGRLAQKRQ